MCLYIYIYVCTHICVYIYIYIVVFICISNPPGDLQLEPRRVRLEAAATTSSITTTMSIITINYYY